MKTAFVSKLIVILFIIMLGIIEGRSQTTFTAASITKPEKKFDFSGTVEGVIIDLATINFSIYEDGNASLTVLDHQGKSICQLVEGEIYKGEYAIHYKPDANLPAGEYFLRFEMNGEVKVERFVKRIAE